MDEHTFKKLAEMLRPILERNEYYASEKRERDRESRSHEGFNDLGGRGYDDVVPGKVTKTAPSEDETT